MWRKLLLCGVYLFVMSQMMGCTTGNRSQINYDKLLEGIDAYRPHPVVKIIEYTEHKYLQGMCALLMNDYGVWTYYYGCASVPFNPEHVCVIHVMKDDIETLLHEMDHCYGYADE